MHEAEAESELFDTAVRFFVEDDWRFEREEQKHILYMRFRGDSGAWSCMMRIGGHVVAFYSVADVRVPEDKRGAVGEFINRANYGLPVGNFAMDHSDGEFRFKTSAYVKESAFGVNHMRNLVYINVMTMDRYLPGLMQVIYGDVSAEEAVRKIESPAE